MKNYRYDLDGILSAVTEKTRVIFIANPNNPTGAAFGRREQRRFINAAPPNVLVVLDEAYAEFADDFPNTLKMIKEYENIVLLKTFSKAYGLASFRVGYAVMRKELRDLYEKTRNPFNVSSAAQAAASAALDDAAFIIETVAKNAETRRFFCGELTKMGLYYIPSQTNFVTVNFNDDAENIFEKLLKRGFITRPGDAFGMKGFLRVSLGTITQMEMFINALKEILR